MAEEYRARPLKPLKDVGNAAATEVGLTKAEKILHRLGFRKLAAMVGAKAFGVVPILGQLVELAHTSPISSEEGIPEYRARRREESSEAEREATLNRGVGCFPGPDGKPLWRGRVDDKPLIGNQESLTELINRITGHNREIQLAFNATFGLGGQFSIPPQEGTTILLSPKGSLLKQPNNTPYYTVQPGDNLSIIARKHGTTTQELLINNPTLAERNGTRLRGGNYLRIGDQLRLPYLYDPLPQAVPLSQNVNWDRDVLKQIDYTQRYQERPVTSSFMLPGTTYSNMHDKRSYEVDAFGIHRQTATALSQNVNWDRDVLKQIGYARPGAASGGTYSEVPRWGAGFGENQLGLG